MQEKLLIYTGLADTEVSWLLVDEQGQAQVQSTGPLDAGLADIAKNKKVVVLLSASDVLLCSVDMPKMSQARLKQAIPYALEEQLLDDPENLHFALGARQPEDSIPVAVVNKAALAGMLNRFRQSGIIPDSVMPVILAVPLEEGRWSALVNHEVLLRSGDYQGFGCEQEHFKEFLAIALAETHSAPEKLLVFSSEQREWQLPVDVEQRQFKQGQWLQVLVPELDRNNNINLLQGEFSSKSSVMPALGKLSKISVYLLGLLLLALLLYPLGSFIILKKRADRLNAATEVIYKKHFPKARKMVSPKRNMQKLLGRAKSPAGEDQLFLLLGYVAKDMSSSIQLQQLNYQNNSLKLQLNAASSDALDQFANALLEQGLAVRQQNVSVTDNGVTATLEIR